MTSSSLNHPVHHSGIYRNLPTFPPSLTNLTAIICGASGISGFHALRVLLSSPDRWARVFILSRKPLSPQARGFLTPDQLSRVVHVPVDLLSSSPEDIAASLRSAGCGGGGGAAAAIDHLFYYAYLQPASAGDAMSPSAAGELIRANAPMFSNLLDALPLAGAVPRGRILLQTGGKHYGMQLGRVRTPLVESDPAPRDLADNFYYHQEDALRRFCADHPQTSWNMVRPAGVIGSSPGSPLNMFLGFGVYATVQASRGRPLVFGGDWTSWQFEAVHSTARLTGYLSEWAVLEEHCRDQAFNAQDGGCLSWDRFFGALAEWFGVGEGVEPPPTPSQVEGKDETVYDRNLELVGGDKCPLRYGPPLVMRRRFTLREWADEPGNREAWEESMAASGGALTFNPWEMGKDMDSVFGGDFAYLAFGTLSFNKTRYFGFNGFVDSLQSVHEMYKELEAYGMLPRMKVAEASPMI